MSDQKEVSKPKLSHKKKSFKPFKPVEKKQAPIDIPSTKSAYFKIINKKVLEEEWYNNPNIAEEIKIEELEKTFPYLVEEFEKKYNKYVESSQEFYKENNEIIEKVDDLNDEYPEEIENKLALVYYMRLLYEDVQLTCDTIIEARDNLHGFEFYDFLEIYKMRLMLNTYTSSLIRPSVRIQHVHNLFIDCDSKYGTKASFLEEVEKKKRLREEIGELGILSKNQKKKKTKKPQIVPIVDSPVFYKKLIFKQEERANIDQLKEEAKKAELAIFDEDKEPLVAMFIGHVDCGKSTICGNIMLLSGMVNELEMEKLKIEAKEKDRESWYLAYMMDINEEEKERGKTVEMGRTSFSTKRKRFTLLDCPGHRNYVQNMISGAAQADLANLVISAKPGEFESGFEKDGQTREHAMLAKSLGAQFIIVVVNKMDTCNWSEERYNYIKNSLEPFLITNCGFQADKIYWTCISGLTNSNMKEPVAPETMPWYKGKTLWETFDDLPSISHPKSQILRIPLLDKFKERGIINTCSKIISGVVWPEMKAMVMPIQKEVVISKILDIDEKEMAYAKAGESVNLIVKGIEEDDLRRGFVICGQQYWIHVCSEFEAEVDIYQLEANVFFGKGFKSIIHLHTILEEIEVISVWKMVENEKNEMVKTKVYGLKSGEKGIARFSISKPICVEKYNEFPDLGRFALRKGTDTIASGRVSRVKPVNKETLKNNAYFLQTENQ